jgi:hypothetical protein
VITAGHTKRAAAPGKHISIPVPANDTVLEDASYIITCIRLLQDRDKWLSTS